MRTKHPKSRLSIESLEHRRVLASLGGQVTNDIDGNGAADVAEPGIGGIDVFFDANGDGQLNRNGSFIEPDHASNGELIALVNSSVTLALADANNALLRQTPLNDIPIPQIVAKTDEFASTGGMVFGHDAVNFFHETLRLRMDFAPAASSVSIDFIGTRPFAGEAGVLQAFDADGNLLGSYETSELDAHEIETMSYESGSSNIAYAVAYTKKPSLNGRLDNLRINAAGSEIWTTTGPDGAYRFNDIAAGDHVVGVDIPVEWNQTFPASGTRNETVADGEDKSGVDFGLQTNTVGGIVFTDAGQVGTYEPGVDTAIEGATVYLDTNGNNQLDTQTVVISADAFGENETVGLSVDGMRVSMADFKSIPRGHVVAVSDSTTGGQVFANPFGTSFTSNQRLRVDFDMPVSGVSIDFVASSASVEQRGAMFAYNAAGEEVASAATDFLQLGQTQNFGVQSSDSQISYVIVFSIQDGEAGEARLDNLQVEGLVSEPATKTGSDGSYQFSPLGDGSYNLKQVLTQGQTNSVPASGTHSVSLSNGQDNSELNFGVTTGSQLSWTNPVNNLDVSGDGDVVPFDALLIINELNGPIYSNEETGLLQAPPDPVPSFFDVDSDGFVTPFDVVLIVNFLNANPAVAVAAIADVGASLDHESTDAMMASPESVVPVELQPVSRAVDLSIAAALNDLEDERNFGADANEKTDVIAALAADQLRLS